MDVDTLLHGCIVHWPFPMSITSIFRAQVTKKVTNNQTFMPLFHALSEKYVIPLHLQFRKKMAIQDAIFRRSELLLGSETMERIAQKRVIIFGVGGVGPDLVCRSGQRYFNAVYTGFCIGVYFASDCGKIGGPQVGARHINRYCGGGILFVGGGDCVDFGAAAPVTDY